MRFGKRSIDLAALGSFFKGAADSFRTMLPLNGGGTTESIELGYPLQFSSQWALEPQGQLLYNYVNFKNSHDNFSTIGLGATSALMGRAGFRLIHPIKFKNYPIVPYLRANFWSVLAGKRTNSVIFANLDNIVSSASSNWAQLGGGLSVKCGSQFYLYAFVDDLVTVGRSQDSLSGIDSGLGVRAFW